MTYEFGGFFGRALYELNGLPDEVRHGLLFERILQLLDAPWDAVPIRPGQTAERHAFFGHGDSHGMITFIIDDDAKVLRFTDIVWLC
ncbi:hypothetical protein [Actinomadura sp. 9N407]|uniref:hypothetical protein n=1 Tax=Actinomadura sp. 9N407 TaxID=3375154 RepID=UPI0037B74241